MVATVDRRTKMSRRVRPKLMTLASLLIVGTCLLASTVSPSGIAVAKGRSPAAITLKIMHWTAWMANSNPQWKALVRGFEAQHPGVTISDDFVTFPQYLPTLTSEAAAKSLPDVFYAHVEAAVLGRAGLTINYRDYLPASFFKRFYSGPMRQFTFNGKI